MARLTPERRALLMDELRTRERYTVKAIARRNGVSRQTLARLRAEMLGDGSLTTSEGQIDSRVKMTQPARGHANTL